jgi:predicted nicotinamide N-methyase
MRRVSLPLSSCSHSLDAALFVLTPLDVLPTQRSCSLSGFAKRAILAQMLTGVFANARGVRSSGTTGLSSWCAAAALAEWACAHKSRFMGKCVVELGCGPGLAGLVVALGCAPASVVLTDGAAAVLELASDNMKLNVAQWRRSSSETENPVHVAAHEETGADDGVDPSIHVAAHETCADDDGSMSSLSSSSALPPVTLEGLDWTLRLAPPMADVIIAADVVFGA